MTEIHFDKSVFNPLFYKLRKSNTRFVISYGGAGSSKSWTQAQNEVIKALESKEKTLIIRKVGTTIKDSTRPLLVEQVIPSFKCSHLWTLNKSDNILTNTINGSQILFRGLDDPEKIKSIAGLTRIWIEEASELTEDDFDQLNLRLRGQENLQIVLTFNPIVETHWIKKRFFDTERGDTTIFKTTYLDNKFIDDAYKEQIESYKEIDPNKYEVYGLGNWGVMDVNNPFITNFRKDKHLSKEAVYNPRKQVYISMDFNLDPFTAICFHIYNNNGEYWDIFDEIQITGGSIETMAREIKTRFDVSNIVITGDAMGNRRDISQSDNASLFRQLANDLRIGYNRVIVPANPKHKTSREDCNFILYHYPNIRIHPNCTNLTRDLQTVEADMSGQIKKKNRNKVEQQADFLDNFRYAVNTFFKDWIVRRRRI
jgi:phage terminase large subunit